MRSTSRAVSPLRIVQIAACVLATSLALTATASAKTWGKKRRYVMDVWKVSVPKGLPAELTGNIRRQLELSIKKNARLMKGVEGAPDPQKFPKQFDKYLKKKRIRYYQVNVELTKFERKVLPMPDGSKGQRLQVSLSVRTFGTTYPTRIIAFAGWGSGKVIIEVGKRGPRKRDDHEAIRAALEVAIDKALARSIKKLDRPKSKPGNR